VDRSQLICFFCGNPIDGPWVAHGEVAWSDETEYDYASFAAHPRCLAQAADPSFVEEGYFDAVTGLPPEVLPEWESEDEHRKICLFCNRDIESQVLEGDLCWWHLERPGKPTTFAAHPRCFREAANDSLAWWFDPRTGLPRGELSRKLHDPHLG
jgi:hypothetical protein